MADSRTMTRYRFIYTGLFTGKLEPHSSGEVVRYAEVAALLTAVAEMEKERAEALKILATRSGDDLLDACRQVKQVAISEADNSEKLEAALAEAETEIARLKAHRAERPA